jgi:uncharacterized membrane protein
LPIGGHHESSADLDWTVFSLSAIVVQGRWHEVTSDKRLFMQTHPALANRHGGDS